MGKEIAAFDLDDVVVPAQPAIQSIYNERHGTSLKSCDYYSRDPALYGVNDLSIAVERVNDILQSSEFLAVAPFDEAIEGLGRISANRVIYFVTGRPGVIQESTINWTEEHFPQYLFRDIIFTNYYGSSGSKITTKADVCKQLGAKELVEDHIDHAINVARVGVSVALFGFYDWNSAKNQELHPNITRTPWWPELLDYFDA